MRLCSIFIAVAALGLTQAKPLSKRVKSFKFFGINESGAEFGNGNLPGTLGTDYTFPSNISISVIFPTHSGP